MNKKDKDINYLITKKELVVDLIKSRLPEAKADAMVQVIDILMDFAIELKNRKI